MRRKVGAKRRAHSAVGKKKGTHRRRRRIGGLSGGFNIGSTLIKAGGVAAGAFAAVEVETGYRGLSRMQSRACKRRD